jgi:ribonuclease HI
VQITIYTDGACDIHADNQPGGWGTILVVTDDNGKVIDETILSGGEEMTTSNRMELVAVIEGLKALKRHKSVKVVSDSKYVINTVTKNFKTNKNQDLWQEFFKLAEQHQIEWKFVKGHAGHTYNERCDRLAVAERQKRAIDTPKPSQSSDIPIKIYLSTAVSGKKNAAWAAVIIDENNSTELSDHLPKTTELEAVLIGAIHALKAVPSDDAVTLYTALDYLSKGMNEWMDGWIKKNWKNNTQNPVKYQDHWKKLLHLSKQRTIHFEFVKNRDDNPYFERGKSITASHLKQA